MSDRRRKIEALRAKADSTTFPAEAAALRAKADELAAQEPKPRDAAANYQAWMAAQEAAFRQPPPQQTPPQPQPKPTVRYENVRVYGNFFEQMGGIRINFSGATAHDAGQRVQVTDVNGRTYWITVE